MAAESFDLLALVTEADVAAESEIYSVVTTDIWTLNTLDQGSIEATGSSAIAEYSTTFDVPGGPTATGTTSEGEGIAAFNSEGNPGEEDISNAERENGIAEGGGPELDVGAGGSLWQKDWEQHDGYLDGAAVTSNERIGIGNGSFDMGVQPNGDIAVEGSISAVQGSGRSECRIKRSGATGDVNAEALGVDGTLGLHDGSLDADVGATLISASGSAGVNLDGINGSVDGTIGLKAELGFEIGPHTEIKLPFVSFGFTIGLAK